MPPPKSLVNTALFLSPAAALFQAGYGLAFSQNAIPQLYDLPPHQSTPLFRRIFEAGGKIAVPMSLTSAAAAAYLARLCTSPTQRKMYIFAALFSILPMPYTGLVMMPGIKRLIAISESPEAQEKSEQDLEHRQLLRGWVIHNYVRTVMYVVGGGLGLWAGVFA